MNTTKQEATATATKRSKEKGALYKPEGIADLIFRERYAAHEKETWEEACERVSTAVARAEINGKFIVWKERFYDLLVGGKLCPGGRIWYGAGRPKQQLLNCFFIPAEDSREGWGKVVSDTIVISGTGGGVGINGSDVRYRGAPIRGTGGTATGAVSLFEVINAAGEVIKAGGGRRTALMLCLDIAHPDVIEFIDKKFTKVKRELSCEGVREFIQEEFGLYDLPKDMKDSIERLSCLENLDAEEAWHKLVQSLSDLFLQRNLKNANVSVVFSSDPEEFFEKVRNDEVWELKWQDKIVTTISAKELWNKIISNLLEGGEPGILNGHLANKMNNIHYHKPLRGSNPCIVGDALVYVADGRGNVKIKDLAKEDKDVPVFCVDDEGEICVRWMRNPRKTGANSPIYKVTFDDGSSVRVTNNHKFKLRNGKYKEVKDLVLGDSLYLLTRYQRKFDNLKRSQDYLWISKPGKRTRLSEHRIISEFLIERKLRRGEIVHHQDFNAQNNSLSNLKVMTKKAHDLLHRKNMLGDKNPMRRAKHEWSKEKWGQYRKNMSKMTSGEKNANYSGVTNEELKKHALELTKRLQRRFSQNDWRKYARENELPTQFSKWRQDHLGGILGIAKWAALELGYDHIGDDPRVVKLYRQYVSLGYDCDIVDGHVFLNKCCEICGKDFITQYARREQALCGRVCSNKHQWNINRGGLLAGAKRSQDSKKEIIRDRQLEIYKDLEFALKRTPLKKEWQNSCDLAGLSSEISRMSSPFKSWKALKDVGADFNHRVVSVELDGYEDVYNGTVDEYHNFFIGAFEGETQKGKKKWSYFNNLQCGEINLEDYGCCDLGSLVLSRFLNEDQTDFDWGSLSEAITAGVRFLDNVLTVNNYPLPEIAQNCQDVRRIGLGVMALHDSLLMMGLKYSSNEGLKKIDQLFNFIKNKAYEASTYLAVEKGSFPKFEQEGFLKSGFVKTLKKSIRSKIKEHGIRNCAMLTIAPTGTTGMLMGMVSTGVEPIFAPAFDRIFNTNNGGKNGKMQERVFHPLFVEMYKQGKSLDHFESSHSISPESHLNVQVICQKHIDNAVSKTINIPAEGYSLEEFSETLMKYIPLLKGLTVYKAGSRGDEPLQALSTKEAVAALQASSEIKQEVDADQLLKQDCPDGICHI